MSKTEENSPELVIVQDTKRTPKVLWGSFFALPESSYTQT